MARMYCEQCGKTIEEECGYTIPQAALCDSCFRNAVARRCSDTCGNCQRPWPCDCDDPVQICGICGSVMSECHCTERELALTAGEDDTEFPAYIGWDGIEHAEF